jgi:hypothetical protein
MIVIGTRVQRLSKLKSALWVRFLSPPSYKDKKLQLYPRSLEPHKGPGQGQDFSLLSALAIQYPSALTLSDIGITERTRAATTAALLQALPTCHKTTGSSTDTAPVSDHARFCPPHWVLRNGMIMYCSASVCCEQTLLHLSFHVCQRHPLYRMRMMIPALLVYSRYTQDPSHRGEAMCHALKPEWIKAENLEMAGLVRRKVWERVLRSSLQSTNRSLFDCKASVGVAALPGASACKHWQERRALLYRAYLYILYIYIYI